MAEIDTEYTNFPHAGNKLPCAMQARQAGHVLPKRRPRHALPHHIPTHPKGVLLLKKRRFLHPLLPKPHPFTCRLPNFRLLLREWVAGFSMNRRTKPAPFEAIPPADRMKDQIRALVSHELRTMLNVVTGFGSLLLAETAGTLNEQQQMIVKQIMRCADQMVELIDDLLDPARLQAGHLLLNPEPRNYPALVEEVVALLAPMFQMKNLSLKRDLQDPGPLVIDGARIMQVITNLLANAIKFTPVGGTIFLRSFLRGEHVVTEIRDTGIGVRREDLPHLFSPFKPCNRLRASTGAGLGLSVAKQIVEQHGGTIEAESPGPQKGSTFRFLLPL